MKYFKMNKGDTFALKIVSENKNYNGKYLIINKIDTIRNKVFESDIVRVKIANYISNEMSESEINNFEYIKLGFFWYECWPGYVSADQTEELKKYMNEYKMIFKYTIGLTDSSLKKTQDFCKDLIYLGNYSLNPPENEFIPKNYSNERNSLFIKERFIEDVIEDYELFNLEKSESFDYDFSEKQNFIHKNARLLTEEYLEGLQKNSVMKSDSKKHRDTLTYVGDE